MIYQIYPRSFADSNGDGIGDLPGISGRLEYLAELGIDAVWISPFYTSPQNDAGYDVADYFDVDPVFGTLADFDELVTRAHSFGIRIIIDIVPNHTSDAHPWFQEAIRSPHSQAREHYIFRPGHGPEGTEPPNNWESEFSGSAWNRLPGEQNWYLSLFDESQPDLNWADPQVQEYFASVLRFWAGHGVDGFRVDVAHGLVKKEGLPDYQPGGQLETRARPYFGQPEVHEIFQDWRRVLDELENTPILVAEAWVDSLEELSGWVRPGEMHQAFNFFHLEASWTSTALRSVIAESLDRFGRVGAPSTWVLSNHDVVRVATRLGVQKTLPPGHGIDAGDITDEVAELGLRRAHAAAALMLSLPGSAYVYQGDELGLPESVEIDPSERQDPSWFRSGGTRIGRDGCRVPLPWERDGESLGFGPGPSWLRQPRSWGERSVAALSPEGDSILNLYRNAIALRRRFGLGMGELTWQPSEASVLRYRNGQIEITVNFGLGDVDLPSGTHLLYTESLIGGRAPADSTTWTLLSSESVSSESSA